MSLVNQILSDSSPDLRSPSYHHRAVSLMPTQSPEISSFRKSLGMSGNGKIVKHIRGGSKVISS